MATFRAVRVRRMGSRLVVFDLDGTLIDATRDLATAVNRALQKLVPGTAAIPEAVVRSFIGEGAQLLVSRSLGFAGVELPLQQVLPVFLECYRGCLLDTTVLYPGIEDTLAALGDRTLAVLTNKPGDLSRTILEGLGVASRFARIYGGGDLPARKPDPVGLLRLLEENGLPAAAAVLVGDSAVDVKTGRAASVRTVGVTYGLDPEGLLREGPDLLIDDIRELPAVL